MSTAGGKNLSAVHKTKILSNPLNRTMTHKDSANNLTGDDATSNSKSQHTAARRPATKIIGNSTLHRKLSSSSSSPIKLENEYVTKKKRYVMLKRELTDKQKTAQDLYNDMSQLREKVIASGAKDPGKLEEFKLEIGPVKRALSPQLELNMPEGLGEKMELEIEKLSIPTYFIETLKNRLQEIPKKSENLYEEILEKHSAFISLVESQFANSNSDENEDAMNPINSEIIMCLEIHRKDHEALKTRLNELKHADEELLTELMKNTNDLYEEYQNYYTRLKEYNVMEIQRNLQHQMNLAMEELQTERERHNQGKERLRQAELQLQKARAKIRELETHATNNEGKIVTLQSNVKSLEGQIKQKDQAMEQRMKDMQKTMKNSEGLVAKVERQRDSFESRLMELKEKMTNKESDALNTINELSEKLQALNEDINVERDKRQQAEVALAEMEERYKNLEDKSNQLCELAEKNKDFTITEGDHTENEVRMFNELQAARVELEEQKEKMMQLQQEKEEIIAVMHQAASREEEENSREKLAAELVFKSNKLQNLMVEYTELKKVAKNAQERSGILEKQLIDIQSQLHTQLKEGGKAALNAHAIELQQQVSDLQNNLAEAIRQKDELENALTQKQLELEQRDRVMREQSKFLKVRDELLGLLKRRNQNDNEETSNSDETNEYMEEVAAKTKAIQELYTTLETKQLQIMRLEKMVKLMEDQQDRAQAQRTRLENRIAQLELALQKNKEYRGKGFGIL